MSKFLALNISISEDGFTSGPQQSQDNPMGEGGMALHQWVFPTKAFSEWMGNGDGESGIDNDYVARGFTNIGANIMGRNMFGPIRGEWSNDWKGWWGDSPLFQHPVYILTNYPRESIDMGNGTIFHFITEGVERACELALESANGQDIRVGGGANTLQQFLSAGILDELHLAYVPVTLGDGEKLFTDPDIQLKNYRAIKPVITEKVRHQTYLKL